VLIDSPRITPQDRQTWERLEHYDDVLSRDRRLDRLADQARRVIAEFLAAGPAYVSTSWGKDSTVVCHLAAQVDPGVTIRWARAADVETPECELVRDAFLALHPGVRYEETVFEFRVPLRGEPGFDDPDAPTQDALAETLDGRRITGVRAEESRIRAISIGHRGLSTTNTCRPIGTWTAVQVFAFLHREGLPVHPVYAMSGGGYYDRRWLRVHPLLTAMPNQSAAHGRDPATWEDLYYADVIAKARAARAHLWAPAS